MNDITQTYLFAIEDELKLALEPANYEGNAELYNILAYHMGWQGVSKGRKTKGKRIRPLLALLTCTAASGDWHNALPAAVAVELVHNFSLIHDDIEDSSPIRHGRPTVWKKWDIPHAINAGDAMFTLAHLQSVRLANLVSQPAALKAVKILQQACLQLTQGQYLDLAFEKRDDVTIDEYWLMVEGKTAALVSASTELGALSAFSDDQICTIYRNFGRLLGLAFQVQDDYLGIWGDSVLTGKSNQSDLLTRKKTLPVLFGLSQSRKFARLWNQKPDQGEQAAELTRLLEIEGAKEFTQSKGTALVNKALDQLKASHPTGQAGDVLIELVTSLSHRQA